MENLKGLKLYIENCVENQRGKLPKGITPYMVYVLIDIYNKLISGKSSEFITAELIPILKKYKINIKENGIGWVAYI